MEAFEGVAEGDLVADRSWGAAVAGGASSRCVVLGERGGDLDFEELVDFDADVEDVGDVAEYRLYNYGWCEVRGLRASSRDPWV